MRDICKSCTNDVFQKREHLPIYNDFSRQSQFQAVFLFFIKRLVLVEAVK